MISRKTLGALALVLVAMIVISTLVSRGRHPDASDGGFVDLLAGFDAGQVSSVKAWLGDAEAEAVELQRSSDGWIVASSWGWSAKSELVQRLLDNLDGLNGELRSKSAEVHGDYEIEDESVLHVVTTGDGGTELFHLLVGKASTRGNCFVRLEGRDDVHLVTGSLRSSFGVRDTDPTPPEGKRWIDLSIYQAERSDVDRIVLQGSDGELILEKEFATPDAEGGEIDRSQWTWKADAAGEFDKNKADGVVGALCNLYANDVVEPGDLDQYGLGEDARSAELTFADGTATTVYFGRATGEDDKFVYFRVGEEGDPAEIYASTVDRIFVARSELQPTEG